MTLVTHELVAFMEDPDNPDIPNVIHSTDAARDYGYDAALVGGVTVYGWTVATIREALGDRWLEDGWAEIAFRRPAYPDDQLTISVDQTDAGHELTVAKGPDDRAITGTVGLGRASWADALHRPHDTEARPRPDTLPLLIPAIAPVGQYLRPMPVAFSAADATRYAVEQEADGDPLWAGPKPRIHPGWLATRCTPFIHHSYDYGSAIHSRSQIQHLAPAYAGQTITVSGTFIETCERKGHHYGVVDCLISVVGRHGSRPNPPHHHLPSRQAPPGGRLRRPTVARRRPRSASAAAPRAATAVATRPSVLARKPRPTPGSPPRPTNETPATAETRTLRAPATPA